jgi:hypothetical protein
MKCAAAAYPVGPDQPRHVLDVRGAQKLRTSQSDDRAQADKQDEDADFFSRHSNFGSTAYIGQLLIGLFDATPRDGPKIGGVVRDEGKFHL